MSKRAAPLSNDTDFVKYTKYSKKAGYLPNLPLTPPPAWQPLRISNPHTFGRSLLPEGVDVDSPIALFSLFFDAEVLDRIVYHTNQHAEKLQADVPPTLAHRRWKPTSSSELYTYLAIVVYMGVHREPSLVEYWQKLHSTAPRHEINRYMAKERWEQLNRYLYCTEVNQSFKSPFGRIWDLSETLRERSFKYWTPGVHLCVDEAIARFTGRASELVIIKTKPTPEGFKIWCLANDGVILNWLFHARGRGPVNLLNLPADAPAFTPTELVPVTLVLAVDAAGRRLFPPNLHIVWDDNLFNTIPMLEYLRSKGVGCAGTVRTTKTATEEKFEATAEAELLAEAPAVSTQARAKLQKERFNSDLMKLKTQYTHKLEWGDTYWALSQSQQVLQAAWGDNQVVLFASTVAERKFLASLLC